MKKFTILTLLVSQNQNFNFYLFIFFTIIGMFFETFTIGLIIPVISQILNPDLIYNYPLILNFFEFISPIRILNNFFNINISSQNEIVITSVFLFFLFFCVKFFYMVFFEWIKASFVFGIYKNISIKLFYQYLNQPILFHINTSSSKLIANITTEVGMFITNAVFPYLRLISETIFMIGIVLLLFVYQPQATFISVTIVLLISISFLLIAKKRIQIWANERQKYDTLRIKTFQEGIGAIDEIKLRNLQDFFLNNFTKQNSIVSSLAVKQSLVTAIPFYLFELIGVLGIVSMVIIIIFQTSSVDNVIISLALFVGAAFKLIPSANRILQAYAYIKYTEPVLNLFNYELNNLMPEFFEKNKITLNFNHDVKVVDLKFKYPNSKKYILNNLNFEIESKSCIGVVGESGVGKTTLVKLIIGLLIPNSGNISIGSQNIYNNLSNWRSSIGYVSQSTFLIDDSILKNIAFGISDEKIDNKKVEEIIKVCQLEKFVGNLPNKIESLVGETGVKISGGEKQRIGIARALYSEPKILVLDEATSSLDQDTENRIIECFKKLKGKITIISIAHKKSSLTYCNHIYEISSSGNIKKHFLDQYLEK